ncbi:MAG: hypothetical protein D6737_08520, partial [Chloroflexi bacterium]
SRDNTLILWDVASGAEIRRFEGHSAAVVSVAFAPDGNTALSASGDNTLILWDVATGERLRTFAGHTNRVNSVAFSPDGRSTLSGSDDRTLRLWRIDTLDELIAWTYANREVIELDCVQRRRFGVEPLCAAGTTTPPSPTPFMTRTPTPTTTPPTPLPTGITIDTPTPSDTPTLTPLFTPTATPVMAGRAARVGSNRGEIVIGGGEAWVYQGRAGEVITIRVAAANPAQIRPGVTRVPDGFDTLLIVRNPDGSELITADDIEAGIITDSLIENLELPQDGAYIIEVRSWDNQSGGRYTLTITRGETATITPYPTVTPSPTP